MEKNKKYLITKTINNNISFSIDENGQEIVIFGKAVGFGKKRGEYISPDQVEKVFQLKDYSQKNPFINYVGNISPEYIDLSIRIIEQFEAEFNHKVNPMMYVCLADHIENAVENAKENITCPNNILNEIKVIYAKEYKVAKQALLLIEETTGTALADEEAGFIVLHYINSIGKEMRNDAKRRTIFVNDILQIVNRHIPDLDPSSYRYIRFITHLNFLASRFFNEEHPENNEFSFESSDIRTYEHESCLAEIEAYIEETYQRRISCDERGYLAIHIHSLTKNKKTGG